MTDPIIEQPHTETCERLNLTLLCDHDEHGRPDCVTDPDGRIALAARAAELVTCTEHLSCRLVGLHTNEIDTVTRQERADAAPSIACRTVVELYGRGEYMGSVRDDGHRIHPSLGGGWRTRWAAFAGGANVYLTDRASTDPDPTLALNELRMYCDNARFHWRMALHP